MANKLCSPDVIRRTLAGHGFRFDKRKGQNFLIAPWVPERMAALFSKGQAVLEIGPGFGALTDALIQTCGHVTAVEKDRLLLPILQQNLSGYDNLTLIEGDALRLDLPSLMPEGFEQRAVCANLPYSLTTPLLTRLIDFACFDPVVVMVQREVARRLAAKPATPEYGAVTVFTALYAHCSVLFDVGPECFLPRPAVTSSVVRLDRVKPDPFAPQALRLVKASFAQRRKTLANALSAGLAVPRETAAAHLRKAGIDPAARGETLSPEDFLALARVFTD
jgi:16S rRNA (adenine1518-N6/adenine1519-N6)-dimethyltransferase